MNAARTLRRVLPLAVVVSLVCCGPAAAAMNTEGAWLSAVNKRRAMYGFAPVVSAPEVGVALDGMGHGDTTQRPWVERAKPLPKYPQPGIAPGDRASGWMSAYRNLSFVQGQPWDLRPTTEPPSAEPTWNWSQVAPDWSFDQNLSTSLHLQALLLDPRTKGIALRTSGRVAALGVAIDTSTPLTKPIPLPLPVLNPTALGAGGVLVGAAVYETWCDDVLRAGSLRWKSQSAPTGDLDLPDRPTDCTADNTAYVQLTGPGERLTRVLLGKTYTLRSSSGAEGSFRTAAPDTPATRTRYYFGKSVSAKERKAFLRLVATLAPDARRTLRRAGLHIGVFDKSSSYYCAGSVIEPRTGIEVRSTVCGINADERAFSSAGRYRIPLVAMLGGTLQMSGSFSINQRLERFFKRVWTCERYDAGGGSQSPCIGWGDWSRDYFAGWAGVDPFPNGRSSTINHVPRRTSWKAFGAAFMGNMAPAGGSWT